MISVVSGSFFESEVCIDVELPALRSRHFEELLQILEQLGTPEARRYLFLGGYVDKGSRSLDTISLLFLYKVRAEFFFFPEALIVHKNWRCFQCDWYSLPVFGKIWAKLFTPLWLCKCVVLIMGQVLGTWSLGLGHSSLGCCRPNLKVGKQKQSKTGTAAWECPDAPQQPWASRCNVAVLSRCCYELKVFWDHWMSSSMCLFARNKCEMVAAQADFCLQGCADESNVRLLWWVQKAQQCLVWWFHCCFSQPDEASSSSSVVSS